MACFPGSDTGRIEMRFLSTAPWCLLQVSNHTYIRHKFLLLGPLALLEQARGESNTILKHRPLVPPPAEQSLRGRQFIAHIWRTLDTKSLSPSSDHTAYHSPLAMTCYCELWARIVLFFIYKMFVLWYNYICIFVIAPWGTLIGIKYWYWYWYCTSL